jgi:hypothetical protein
MSITLQPTIQVYTKASKWNNNQPKATEFAVNIERNKSITIFRNGQEGSSFVLGAEAEYDSYNLKYTGTITKITDKLVQITAYPGTQNERRRNLNLHEFCYRNHDFNAEKVAKHNAYESMFI